MASSSGSWKELRFLLTVPRIPFLLVWASLEAALAAVAGSPRVCHEGESKGEGRTPWARLSGSGSGGQVLILTMAIIQFPLFKICTCLATVFSLLHGDLVEEAVNPWSPGLPGMKMHPQV